MTTDSVPKTTVQQRDGWTRRRHGQGRRHARAEPGHDARRPHHRRRRRPADVLGPALKTATGVSFERVDSDGCLSTNDTVIVLASGASGDHARAPRSSPRRSPPRPPTWPCSCSPTPRGRPRTSRSPSATPPACDDALDRRPGRAPATTCSRRRCSATTPTGAGCSPRSAPPTPPSRPTRSTSPSTASRSAGAARSATRARASTSPAGRSPSTSTCRPAPSEATIWTNDLSIAYVHENSAYST